MNLLQDLDYYELTLDSAQASISRNSTNPLNWPSFPLTTSILKVRGFKILEAQIPFSFNSINATNNTFQIRPFSNPNSPIGPYVFTIPPGNYGIDSLLIVLNAVDSPYTVFSYSQTTNLFTVQRNDLINPNFYLDFPDSLLAGMIGFNKGTTQSSSSTIVAPQVSSLTGSFSVYINSKELGPLINFYTPDSSTAVFKSSKIGKIPLNGAAGTVTYWQDTNPFGWFDLRGKKLASFVDFYLTILGSDIPLDLNGKSFSLKIGLLTEN